MQKKAQWMESMNLQLSAHIYQIQKAVRHKGCDTGWRSLPATLIEMPVGGKWTLHLKDRKEPVVVEDHEVIVIPTGTMHRLVYSGARPMKTSFMFASFRWIGHIDVFNVYRFSLPLPRSAGLKLDQIISEIDRTLAGAPTSITDTSRIHELAFRALGVILPHRRNEHLEFSRKEYERIEKILRLLNEDVKNELSCQTLAAKSHLSVSRFHTIFKRVTGSAPKIYQQNMRLTRAVSLLIATQDPIKNIADECGFHSPYYFTRLFTKYVGLNPSQFRLQFGSSKKAAMPEAAPAFSSRAGLG